MAAGAGDEAERMDRRVAAILEALLRMDDFQLDQVYEILNVQWPEQFPDGSWEAMLDASLEATGGPMTAAERWQADEKLGP